MVAVSVRLFPRLKVSGTPLEGSIYAFRGTVHFIQPLVHVELCGTKARIGGHERSCMLG